MSSKDQPDTAPDKLKLNTSLFLDVAFSFESQWRVGPDGHLSHFPPGGSLGAETIQIGPVNLSGLSAEQIAMIVVKRTADMALVATAIAVATRQLATALEEVHGAPPGSPSVKHHIA